MRVLVPLYFIFFITCASHNEPEWLTTQPQTEGYWFGIGTIQKPIYGNECREEARNKALAEISSQISVDIVASFERVVKEHNLNLDEFSRSVIKTRVNNNLPNVRYVDFFESKDKCGLLARLSKSSYYETIELQRRNAVQSALGLLSQAESDFNIQTFTYLSEAINEIVPYMDIPIEEEYPSGSGRIVNLYSYIKVLANTSINRFNLVPVQETVEIKRGFTRDLQLSVRVLEKNNNSPIVNIPVTCYIDQSEKSSLALSDENGNCIFPVPSIRDNKSIQYINFAVNIDEILHNTKLFGILPEIQAQSTLHVNPPKIFIQIIENNLGETTDNPYIQPVITEIFARYFSANFVDIHNADLIVQGTVNTRSVSDMPNEWDLYQAFGDFTISISNRVTGEKLLEKTFNKVQGSDFQSNREAANQSLKKISEKITEEFLPEIIDIMKNL